MLIMVATEAELEPLISRAKLISEKPWITFEFKDIPLLISGVGPINSAGATSYAILKYKPKTIVNLGIGGAYPKSKIKIGEIVAAEREVMFNDFEKSSFNLFVPSSILQTIKKGTFITLLKPSEKDEAELIEKETGAICENMEGAAIAKIAEKFDVRVIEIRAISNIAGVRDKKYWDIKGALRNLWDFFLSSMEAIL